MRMKVTMTTAGWILEGRATIQKWHLYGDRCDDRRTRSLYFQGNPSSLRTVSNLQIEQGIQVISRIYLIKLR